MERTEDLRDGSGSPCKETSSVPGSEEERGDFDFLGPLLGFQQRVMSSVGFLSRTHLSGCQWVSLASQA